MSTRYTVINIVQNTKFIRSNTNLLGSNYKTDRFEERDFALHCPLKFLLKLESKV